ncbi:alpha/beta fold hydrolase [Merismopedia glauca]|uniref:Alpha/beta hydrolase n=1 Tax=Merismopedia glauca CCAP 1448/3 TaxID=1296344 RepID=A0A2T1C0U0_9CYAN|nr:alpha/beta hydrolase [Merismopedia glauca]PSB01881.1 alpha/beta hydrolase [Merismopedia glauca CCAP 1448/3]
MLSNFQQKIIETKETKINVVKSGTGFPLLLLHGYPQNHLMWHKIAPDLAKDFTVVATDLRGYGDSSKPQGDLDHRYYSKRIMAQDQVEVMSQLGYSEFYLVGHDRGARVAHRLTLDYPEKVKKLALLDIIPTYELYQTSDREFASSYYHWFFLIQPYPLPETLIGANPEYFLQACLQSWSRDFAAFTPEVLAEYIRCFNNPATIHATCEDYRAAATIDLIDDELDLNQKIQCPVLVLWGNQGIIGRKYDVLSIWRQRAVNVIGKGIECGHFLAEENPDQTYLEIREFLLNYNASNFDL